jgi:Ca2+-binding RTX toxin-like protein
MKVAILGSVADRLFKGDNVISDLEVVAKDLGDVVNGIGGKIIRQGPIKIVKEIAQDASHAIFGQDGPHVVRDTVNFVQGVGTLASDTVLNVFNSIPSSTNPIAFDVLPGSINAQPNKVITDTHYHSEASIGDLSWLIYKAKTDTNKEITDKWKLYSDVETSHGYNSRVYVDKANKQVAITLEGTQPNSKLSPLWLSKDGLADLEIGLGVIPPQMREGYKEFKKAVADVEDNFVAKGYGISVAGHSLGGGLAQMMAGMYFIDTGKALPTIAQAGPGMLRQLKIYAEEQLLAGETIHLPTGGTVKLGFGTLVQRADQAKAIVNTFKAEDFSNVVNLITELDPVGAVNYNMDPNLDGHVGVNMKVPYLLTAREDLQDLQAIAMKLVNSKNITTPSQMPNDPLGMLPGFHDIHVTRFDRHEPDQSCALWSGTTVGLKKLDGDIGLGTAVFRDYGDPKKVWAGSQVNIPEVKIFGDNTNSVINVSSHVTGKQNALVLTRDGNHTVYGSNNGDFLIGGAGNDTIYGGSGDNYISGGSGNAKLFGGAGNDIIHAGSGNCYMDGGAGDNVLCGGTGDNTFVWSANGNNIYFGGTGNDTFDIKQGVQGSTQIKWERNFIDFGTDVVRIEGAMASDSHLLLNFADEIRFQDMKWSQNGNDIIMTDNLGAKPASVTFQNAFESFGKNSDQIDFQFTNGRLYLDDELYHVRAGQGTVTALDDPKYKGNILIGSAGNDTLVSGKGNDILFGGEGQDTFVFNDNFGNDMIVGSNHNDKVQFNTVFNAAEFDVKRKGDNLLIDYQVKGFSNSSELTIVNWYTNDKVNQFVFTDGMYKIENNNFIKIL